MLNLACELLASLLHACAYRPSPIPSLSWPRPNPARAHPTLISLLSPLTCLPYAFLSPDPGGQAPSLTLAVLLPLN